MSRETSEKGSILIVDDNPTNLGVLSDYFSDSGWEILVAQDGEAAIETVEYAHPDIVLLDIIMPVVDGFETCRHLKANPSTKDIPVIFMSALSETVDKVRGFQLGAVDYISKPVQQEEVLARVNTHLSIRNLTRRLQEQNIRLQQEIRNRQQAEEQLLGLQAELYQALAQEKELNELKSRIISTISHEYRTPLTIISSSAEILEAYRHKLDESKQLKHLERIKIAANHLTDLVNDVLFLSRVEFEKLEFQPEFIDLVSFFRELVEELQVGVNEAHQLIFTSSGECRQFYGDTKLLRQIFTNLFSNAFKYSPNGGKVSIQLICETHQVILQVGDQGIGIPPEDQGKLFDSFNRGKNVGTIAGTGLGLSIVKKCVELHNGKILVESVVGTGTTFTVSLPLREPINLPIGTHQQQNYD
ncbi:ATP-binding protein [Lyngbya aestuarii]|uniref:ATP-binding protein n=1 Tax=Lyngbya aestuarii TaxID=118322 RepID=UPI00403DBCF9